MSAAQTWFARSIVRLRREIGMRSCGICARATLRSAAAARLLPRVTHQTHQPLDALPVHKHALPAQRIAVIRRETEKRATQ